MHTSDWINDIITSANTHISRPAMVIEEKTYTYGQLLGQAWDICTTLCTQQADVIGIVAENCMETYASILAVLFSGKTYVILHPDYPAKRNRLIARQADIRLLLYSKKRDVLPPDVEMDSFCTNSRLYTAQPRVARPRVASDVPAYIIFTSGSTGEPKGVPISRDNLNAFYTAYRKLGWNLDETDRMLQMFELTFDVSVVSFLYPLAVGACIYTVPQSGMKYLNVLDIMERHQLTFAAIAPSVLRLSRPYFPEVNLPHLRYLVVTAEATDVSLLADFRPCIPQAEVVNLYGPTETTIYCTSYPMPLQGCKQHSGMAAIGKPFVGMESLIAGEDGQPLPAGQTGELWISGPQVMKGYWKSPEKTAESFMATPNGKLFYRTGDLCCMDADGDLIYCGRKDAQVKIQGFRVELGEIEHQAKAFYRHTCNAVVLPILDKEGNCELHLAVEGDGADGTHELESYLQERLPSYMLPKHIHFFASFPLNANNKTDRKTIKQNIENHANN